MLRCWKLKGQTLPCHVRTLEHQHLGAKRVDGVCCNSHFLHIKPVSGMTAACSYKMCVRMSQICFSKCIGTKPKPCSAGMQFENMPQPLIMRLLSLKCSFRLNRDIQHTQLVSHRALMTSLTPYMLNMISDCAGSDQALHHFVQILCK